MDEKKINELMLELAKEFGVEHLIRQFEDNKPEPEPEINWNVRPKFKGRDICWFTSAFGGMDKKPYDRTDSHLTALEFMGELYRTKEEYNWYRRQRLLIIEMEDFIGFDDLDWNDVDQEKWYYQYTFLGEEWRRECEVYNRLLGLFPPCPSEEKVKETHDKFKDRLDYLKPYDGRNE